MHATVFTLIVSTLTAHAFASASGTTDAASITETPSWYGEGD
jgi:hypothetical protein